MSVAGQRMRQGTARWWPVIAAGMILAGCGDSGPSVSTGEGEPCGPKGTCNPGLTCLSGYCVNAHPDTGTETTGDVADAADPGEVRDAEEAEAAAGELPGDTTGDETDNTVAEVAEGTDLPGEAVEDAETGTDATVDACVRQCVGRQCGDDGCGGTCGTCPGAGFCIASQCVANPCPEGFVAVHPGTFTMGSPEDEPGRFADETRHEVTLTRGFCLKATEVTEQEWVDAIEGLWPPEWGHESLPRVNRSWWEAVQFCNQLSRNEGLPPCYVLTGCADEEYPWASCTGVRIAATDCEGYRLPTEAEWEYAARAGTTSATYNGTSDEAHAPCVTPNEMLDPIAWYCGDSGNRVQVVGGKAANALGLYDMLGNAMEWVWDAYGEYPAGTATDPTGATEGAERVARGGSYLSGAAGIRAAYRYHTSDLAYGRENIGFRVARTIRQ